MHIVKEAQQRGCKIVVIDPLHSQTASKADVYIQINSSTDGALALGMARYIIDHELYDGDWLVRNTKGYGWNHKRVYRIYRQLELNLRIKPKRRIKRDKPDALQVDLPSN